jgi:hypothetical protein
VRKNVVHVDQSSAKNQHTNMYVSWKSRRMKGLVSFRCSFIQILKSVNPATFLFFFVSFVTKSKVSVNSESLSAEMNQSTMTVCHNRVTIECKSLKIFT